MQISYHKFYVSSVYNNLKRKSEMNSREIQRIRKENY